MYDTGTGAQQRMYVRTARAANVHYTILSRGCGHACRAMLLHRAVPREHRVDSATCLFFAMHTISVLLLYIGFQQSGT